MWEGRSPLMHIPTFSIYIARVTFLPLVIILHNHVWFLTIQNKASNFQILNAAGVSKSWEPFNSSPTQTPTSRNWCWKNFLPLVWFQSSSSTIHHVIKIKSPALFVTIVTVLRRSKMVDEFRWNFRKFERIASYSCTYRETLQHKDGQQYSEACSCSESR